MLNLTTKRARTNRSVYSYSFQVGSWDQLRNAIDVNQVIVKDRLALRLMAVDNTQEGWRKWDFSDLRRGTASLTWQPTTTTKISAFIEDGNSARHQIRPWNAEDQLALWDAQGRPTKTGAASM